MSLVIVSESPCAVPLSLVDPGASVVISEAVLLESVSWATSRFFRAWFRRAAVIRATIMMKVALHTSLSKIRREYREDMDFR